MDWIAGNSIAYINPLRLSLSLIKLLNTRK